MKQESMKRRLEAVVGEEHQFWPQSLEFLGDLGVCQITGPEPFQGSDRQFGRHGDVRVEGIDRFVSIKKMGVGLQPLDFVENQCVVNLGGIAAGLDLEIDPRAHPTESGNGPNPEEHLGRSRPTFGVVPNFRGSDPGAPTEGNGVMDVIIGPPGTVDRKDNAFQGEPGNGKDGPGGGRTTDRTS